jgi:hypothetical protein
MEAQVVGKGTWSQTKDRRVLREYLTVQEMLDDIWRAHEQGWLPISMTEKRLAGEGAFRPWNWLNKRVAYVVAYRHTKQ